jgi:hypothetical protein
MRALPTIARHFVKVTVVLGAIAFHAQTARAEDRLDRFCVTPTASMSVSASPECASAFAHALQATGDTDEVVVTAAPLSTMKGVAPLRFQKRAPWVRRLERIGKEGIAFVRVPQGPGRELVIGINRKGRLGFQLRQVSDR